MIEILKFVLSGFWKFIGFTIILYITLFFLTNGLVQIIKGLTKRKNVNLTNNKD